MDITKFIKACQEQPNPIDLFDVALGVFSSEIPEEIFEHNDSMMSVELLANILFEEKEFEKAEQFINVLRCNQQELYQESTFYLLPELIIYYLHKGDIERVEFYMMDIAIAPKEDFLLFAHLLDVIDAYGYDEVMSRIVGYVLSLDLQLDEDDIEILESYLVSIDPLTEDPKLIQVSKLFLDSAPIFKISNVTAENIINAMTDYFEHRFIENYPDKILLDELSFRNYIASMIDSEFMDTYEYAAFVLWGSVYVMDALKESNLLTPQETEHNLDVIQRVKAFFLVNIPWDGYWKLKFLFNWEKPASIDATEFDAERRIVEKNLYLKPKDFVNQPIGTLFGTNAQYLSYAKYLDREQELFEQILSEEESSEFGADKKHDSVFPFINVLTGEAETDFKPAPQGNINTEK